MYIVFSRRGRERSWENKLRWDRSRIKDSAKRKGHRVEQQGSTDDDIPHTLVALVP